MQRNDFINMFSSFGFNRYNMLDTSIDIPEETDKKEIVDIIIKQAPLLLNEEQKKIFSVEEDWSYMSDDPETDDWRYNVKCDLNKLYDSMNFKNENIKTIYRLCNKEGKGVYDNGIGFKYLNSNQGSPYEDENFKFIFPDIAYQNQYQKQWKFGCKDIEQLKIWIDKEENIEPLIKQGIMLAVIDIPENFVIEGKEQIIFHDKYVKNIEYHNLNTLFNKIQKSHKPQF